LNNIRNLSAQDEKQKMLKSQVLHSCTFM